MRVVEKGEQQRHRDGLQLGIADRLDQRRQFVLGQRRHHVALRIDPFGDLEPLAPRHQHRGSVLQQVVQIGARRSPQFQEVAEAARGDEAGARALVLQQRVGHHGGGVRQQRHVGRIDRFASSPCRMPSITAWPKSCGVVGSLAIAMRPVASSTSATSVKVPPMSMPIRHAMRLPLW